MAVERGTRTKHWLGWAMGADRIEAAAARATNWMVNESRDGELVALARLQPAVNGRVEITALWLERTDGGPLAVRDFGSAHLGELQQAAQHPLIRGSLAGRRDDGSHALLHPVKAPPRRSGPRGMPPEHWQTVEALWLEAREVAQGRVTTWMQERWTERYGEKIPIPTMDRWRKRVESKDDNRKATP